MTDQKTNISDNDPQSSTSTQTPEIIANTEQNTIWTTSTPAKDQPKTNEEAVNLQGLSNKEFIDSDSAAVTKSNLNLWDRFVLLTNFSWPKIIAIFLAVQGIIGIYSSVRFIFVEYPKLDFLLDKHLLPPEEIRAFTDKAFVTVMGTVVNMFLAIRISIIPPGLGKKIETAIGSVFLVASSAINRFFGVFDLGQIFYQILQLFIP
ncbi:MAG: hypothetical protein ACOZAN_01170 [Patescibacteria group bacterium]